MRLNGLPLVVRAGERGLKEQEGIELERLGGRGGEGKGGGFHDDFDLCDVSQAAGGAAHDSEQLKGSGLGLLVALLNLELWVEASKQAKGACTSVGVWRI